MARKFTAEEVRELAEMIDHGGAFALTDPSIVESNVAMLLQAADDMAREKKYEYSVKEFGGYVQPLHEDSIPLSFLDGRAIGDENYVIVRRSVGEWEAVK